MSCRARAREAQLRQKSDEAAKPIMEERARANLIASGGDKKSDDAKSGSQKSDEPIKPIRTDEAVTRARACEGDYTINCGISTMSCRARAREETGQFIVQSDDMSCRARAREVTP